MLDHAACGCRWYYNVRTNRLESYAGTHRYYADFKIGSVNIDTKNDYLIVKDAAKIQAVRDQKMFSYWC